MKTMTALARMLEKPDIDQVLDELRKIEKQPWAICWPSCIPSTSVRPGGDPPPASGLRGALPDLDQTRDDHQRSQARRDATAKSGKGKAKLHDFFSAMDLDHISGKRRQKPPPAPVRQP